MCFNTFKTIAIFPNKLSGMLVNHHRWLKISTDNGDILELRPDGGVAHNWTSYDGLKYNDVELDSPTLETTLKIRKWNKDKDMLYYIIFKQA